MKIVMNSCNAGSGTYGAMCPTSDHFLGHCIPKTLATFESATYNYGEPGTAAPNAASCTGGGGTWCPAP